MVSTPQPREGRHTLAAPRYMPVYFSAVVSLIVTFAAIIWWPDTSRTLDALAFAAIAGLWGGNQNLCLKCTMEMIKESLKGDNQWLGPTPYIMVVITIRPPR